MLEELFCEFFTGSNLEVPICPIVTWHMWKKGDGKWDMEDDRGKMGGTWHAWKLCDMGLRILSLTVLFPLKKQKVL